MDFEIMDFEIMDFEIMDFEIVDFEIVDFEIDGFPLTFYVKNAFRTAFSMIIKATRRFPRKAVPQCFYYNIPYFFQPP